MASISPAMFQIIIVAVLSGLIGAALALTILYGTDWLAGYQYVWTYWCPDLWHCC